MPELNLLDERFWRKILFCQECWLWDGYIERNGYGYVKRGGKRYLAHRYSYQLVRGPIPEGLELDHLCRVPACVNPFHLEAVTHAVNMSRAVQPKGKDNHFGARTHCPQGHPYDEQNTYRFVTRRGGIGRQCRTCSRARNRVWAAKRKAGHG